MKKWIALLLALTLALSLAACGIAGQSKETDGEPSETGMMAFTVIVVHADGSSKEFTYETTETYVGPVLTADGLLKGNDGPYGLEITEVDGERAVYETDKAYWAVYVGEEYALTGIDTTPVENGGVYKLVYTRA